MFLTAEVTRFFEAWKKLRAGDAIPHYRALFEALAPDLIPGMMLFEQAPDERYIVRFMGTMLVALWGEDLTGKDRFASMPAKVAKSAQSNLRAILGFPCGGISVQPYGTKMQVETEFVLLPVGNDPGKPSRVVAFAQDLRGASSKAGPEEPPEILYEPRWIDLGFGVPDRRPVAIFRR